MAEKLNKKDDIYQHISRFLYSTTPEWNVLNFWYAVDIKNYNVKLKNQNGGLIQDGDENIFYFSHNKPLFWFLAWQHWFYFIIAFELHNKKNKNIIQRLFYNKILKFFEKYHLSY
jgi:hypothetical protein